MTCGDLYYLVIVGESYDLSRDVSTLTVEEDREQPSRLVVHCSDPYKVLSDAIREGMTVSVSAGYHDEHALLFRGRIHRVDADFPREGVATLSLQAHDNRMLMGLRNRNRPWTDKTLEDIVRTIAHPHFAQVNVEIPGNPRFAGNGIRQQNETDLAFLLRLSRQYGCEMFVEPDLGGDRLYFLSQRTIMDTEPEVSLYHGRAGVDERLLSFQSNADVSQLQLPRLLTGIDYLDGTVHEVAESTVEDPPDGSGDAFFLENLSALEADRPAAGRRLAELLEVAEGQREAVVNELGEAERVTFPGFVSAEELRNRQDNHFNVSRQGMQGSGTALGNRRIRANHTVRLGDLGARFSGIWYLSQVRHRIDAEGFTTEFSCQR